MAILDVRLFFGRYFPLLCSLFGQILSTRQNLHLFMIKKQHYQQFRFGQPEKFITMHKFSTQETGFTWPVHENQIDSKYICTRFFLFLLFLAKFHLRALLCMAFRGDNIIRSVDDIKRFLQVSVDMSKRPTIGVDLCILSAKNRH